MLNALSMCLWNMIYGNLIDIRIEDLYRAIIDVTDHVVTNICFTVFFYVVELLSRFSNRLAFYAEITTSL